MMGMQIAPCEGAIFMGKDILGYARRHYADVSCAKMAEPTRVFTEMPFGLCGLWAHGSMRYMGQHWRHLANAIEKFMCGSDAAFFVKLR